MTINFDKKSLLGFIIEAVILIGLLALVWGYYNDKLNDSEQNIKAMRGRVEQVELQNSQLLASRDSYIATINDLEELLDVTKKEVRMIQQQLDSKIAYISKIEQNIKVEYIEVVKDSIVYVTNNKLIATFHYQDDWLSFNGENEFEFGDSTDYKTSIHNINMNTPLTVGLTDDYKIFVTTPNPYISFSSIEGAVLDNSIIKPKKKRFSWGIQLGVGAMYDIIKKDVAVGPYGGLGAEFNF